ncbi:hypothetical protein WA026_021552 [Henosepilachna vigintioctopunctata]|uniref:RING-CH-type domain-containing protein n=1 Tax=Henosepilachna vigintioctopunctata TaxID=420089 RepID=A0AAW1VID0_9CUCU
MSKDNNDFDEIAELNLGYENQTSSSSNESKSRSSVSNRSLKFPFSTLTSSKIKFSSDLTNNSSNTSGSSSRSHYIYKVVPNSVPYVTNPKVVDDVFSQKESAYCYGKQFEKLNAEKQGNDFDDTSPTNSVAENFLKKVASPVYIENNIPNSDLKSTENGNSDEKGPDNSTNNIESSIVANSSHKKLAVPRMTSSDSQISTNRRYFQEIGKKFVAITENGCCKYIVPKQLDFLKETPKTPTQISENLKLFSENISTANNQKVAKVLIAPTSLFENDNYKSFSDSNSPEEDIIESIKSANCRIKPPIKEVIGRMEIKNVAETKDSSLVSVPSTVCRICHTNTANERLLSPCYCKGTLAYVHLSCLERWLNQSSRSYCELCLYQYNAVETLRYGLLEGIRLWIRHPRNRNHVRSDCLIAFLLTLVTIGLVVISLIGMDYFIIEGIKLGFSKIWTKSFIVSFLGIILMGYAVTMYLILRDEFVPWYNWWKNTLNIHLLLNPTVLQTRNL